MLKIVGHVKLSVRERVYTSRICIRFRAEEIAKVKMKELGNESRSEWIHETITTFFDTEWTLYGDEAPAYLSQSWQCLQPGNYSYPFALKFPHVNYPPSTEDPSGFAIRFIWTAQVETPAGVAGIKSRDCLMPYRPIIVTSPDREWLYKTTLCRDKKIDPFADVHVLLYRQSFCPEELLEADISIRLLGSDAKVMRVHFRLRKHYEGKMLVQGGTAFTESTRIIRQGKASIQHQASDPHTVFVPLSFHIPNRLVSPSFCSRHIRIHYDLLIDILVEHGHIIKGTHSYEVTVPFSIGNLPRKDMTRVPGLTDIRHYEDSCECPLFFDPDLDDAPISLGNSPNTEGFPGYMSMTTMPSTNERFERTVHLSRPARGTNDRMNLSEAVIIPGLLDEDW